MKYIYVVLILFITIPLFAQVQISGKIQDATGVVLPGASIILKDSVKIIAYAISSEKGLYELQVKKAGAFKLEVSFLGMEKQSVAITVAADTKNIVKNFSLTESHKELKEVVIDYEPIKLKGDTLVYDAKVLSTGREVVVEDLLKNIPGITIAKDGTIKYGDTPIEKVMVEGDDLFNRGYSILTKNMPSKPLDKVEILQNYSNNKLLKGVEDSKAVALNLTVQEEYKNIWFGDLLLGYGNDNRYLASGNLMNFGKKYKAYFTTSFNNAGYDRVGNISDMAFSSNDMESIGMGGKASQVMNLSARAPFSENRTRFNDAEMATLSTIFPLSPKVKLKLVGFLSYDELSTYQNSLEVRDFGSTYFENTENNNSLNDIKKGYAKAFLTYDVSKTKMLESSSTYSGGNNNFTNDLTFNGVSTREALETKDTYFDQKLTYTYKWKDRNVVLVKGRFFTDKLPQYYSINDYLMGDLFTYDNIAAMDNTIASSRQYAGLEADFNLKQENKDLIKFTVGFDNNDDEVAAQFRLFTDAGGVYPDGFQSNSAYKVGDLYARSGYTWRFEKFSLSANLNAHQLFNRFENYFGETKTQNPFFVNPALNASWSITPDNTLSARYMYNVSNSSLLQVNDAYLLKSSRSFSRGLGDFNQLESSAAGVSYTTKHYLNRYSFTVGAEYSKQNDVITYRSQIEQNSSLSEAFIMRGGDRIGVDLNSHFVIKKLKGTLRLDASGNRFVYYNQVNDSELRKNTSYNQTYGFGWKSTFKSMFNFDFGSDWTLSKVKSDYTFNSTNSFSFFDLIFQVNKQFNIQAKTEYYYYGGEDTGNNYFFADVEARYAFKDDTYTIGLDGRNLFDTKNFTTYSVSDIGYSTNSYRLLPRYVLLTFKFRF